MYINSKFKLCFSYDIGILSAYRSKVACYGADVNDRKRIVPGILALVGEVEIGTKQAIDGPGICLEQSDFLHVMYMIHTHEKQGMLNPHFIPQHLYCFRHVMPSQWTVVAQAKTPNSACLLEHVVLGGASLQTMLDGECGFKKTHATAKKSSWLPAEDALKLDIITRDEYEVLGPYLA